MINKLLNKLLGTADTEKKVETAKEIASPLTMMLDKAKTSTAAMESDISVMEDRLATLKTDLAEVKKLSSWLEAGVPQE